MKTTDDSHERVGDEGVRAPARPDLAIGALQVALATTTDAEVKPWLLTAMDFLEGTYEPLDDGPDLISAAPAQPIPEQSDEVKS